MRRNGVYNMIDVLLARTSQLDRDIATLLDMLNEIDNEDRGAPGVDRSITFDESDGV